MNDSDLIYFEWYVVVDDLIGGVAIATANKPTSQLKGIAEGEFEIGNFFSENLADHIVQVHNTWLKDTSGRA